MAHQERNKNLLFFLVLPIIGFLLGWSMAQKTTADVIKKVANETPVEVASTEEPIGVVEEKPDEEKPEKVVAKKKNPSSVNMDIFWETWKVLDNGYLYNEKFDDTAQVHGAIKGLVESLDDPHSVFLDPSENKEFHDAMGGDLEGIGAEIGTKDNVLTVIRPLKDSPAERAGLRPGDIILLIDEEITQGMNIYDAVKKIRGPKGEEVVLQVLREGEESPLDIAIIRDAIQIKSVEWEMKGDENDIAYIAISQFGTEVTEEFQDAVNQVILKRPAGIILDLRNNNGGLLDATLTIGTKFFDNKALVQTKGRRFLESGELITAGGGAFIDTPLIVLINKGTASAAEIFAGAVQDYQRGVVIGETSYGKGTVQHVIPLSDGSSLKVTVAEWLTPNGRTIEGTGMEPDIAVEFTEEDWVNGADPVLERALEVMNSEEMTEIMKDSTEEESEIAEEK